MSSLVFKNPTTPSQRHVSFLKRTTLMKTKILKNQSCFLKNRAGRNNQGRITSFHKGGGHKKKYRIVSYNRPTLSGIVESIEYDPYRSANIARVFSEIDNTHSYILAPEGLVRGNYINSQLNKTELTFKIGNLFYLKDLPIGVFVHNISFSGGRTGVARSAGCGAQIVSKDDKYCRLRLNSGEHRLFPLTAHATLGILSNPSHNLVNLGKAGRSRWLNKRPTVRGVAMNPIDHPHGGGEGRTSGGRHPVTPWGRPTKGARTRSNRSTDKYILRSRHSKKKGR